MKNVELSLKKPKDIGIPARKQNIFFYFGEPRVIVRRISMETRDKVTRNLKQLPNCTT